MAILKLEEFIYFHSLWEKQIKRVLLEVQNHYKMNSKRIIRNYKEELSSYLGNE